MKAPLEFIYYYAVRFLSVITDLFCAAALTFVIFTSIAILSVTFHLTFLSQVWLTISLIIGLPILGWSAYEAHQGLTPGRRALGLELKIEGTYAVRFLRLIVRNLLKFGQIYLSCLLSEELTKKLVSYGSSPVSPSAYDGNAWVFLLLLTLFWLLISLGLNAFGTDRHLQDWVSGTQILVKADNKRWSGGLLYAGGIIVACCVVLLLPVLFLSSLNFTGDRPRAKISSVKANMHTFQTIVETYAVDWGGVYPPNVEALKIEATQPGREYWKDFSNPYTDKSGKDSSYTDISHIQLQKRGGISSPRSEDAGLVLYSPVWEKKFIVKYFIYGLDKAGQTVLDKGQDFTLSNN